MKYNALGRTGILVSEVCFGCMTFGGRGRWTSIGTQPQAEVTGLLRQAFEAGVNFIDTANIYSEGLSEEMTGQALRDIGVSRSRVFLATKLRGRMGQGVNELGLSRGHILDSVEASLQRLGLDHIDLLYVHGLDPLTHFEETMRGLDQVVRSGKVRYLGACNIPAWQIMKANSIAERHGWPRFEALQYFYSIGGRDLEHDVVPMALDEELAIMPWSPLAGGLFSGKYDRNTREAGESRRDKFDFPPVDREKAHDIIDVMQPIAQAHGVSGAQVALAWLRQRPGVTSTIIGAKRADQLTDNLAAYSLVLTPEEIEALDTVSATRVPYPNWMVSVQNQDRTQPGPVL